MTLADAVMVYVGGISMGIALAVVVHFGGYVGRGVQMLVRGITRW